MDRERTVRQLKALGEPSRLDLFLRVAHGEVGGTSLLEETGLSQPNLSRHIKVLREAGVIQERWSGRSAFYRLSEEPLPVELAQLLGKGPSAESKPEPKNIHDDESNISTEPADTEDKEGRPAPFEDWLL
jgi:DNA-binding transcriptional ArsR family regulator